jgi:hypothetical protein
MSTDSRDRSTVFISHATPDDNDFAIWLASRLSMAGYEVWCDQEKLLGGEDFWDDIDGTIRNETIKFLLVMSEQSFNDEKKLRRGIQKEVALADTIGIQISIENFIVPLRIDKVEFSDFSIDFHRLNGIDCSDNWAAGFAKLLKVLERDEVPCSSGKISNSLTSWRAIHQFKSQALRDTDETVQTNWLKLVSMPESIHAYEILRRVKPMEPRAIASGCSLPCSEHGQLLLSFADLGDLQWAVGDTVPLKKRSSIRLENFVRGEVGNIPVLSAADAKRKLSSLLRQGIESTLEKREITRYEMANQAQTYWFKPGMVDGDVLRFRDFNGKTRRRAVVGHYGKKRSASDPNEFVTRYYWHLGFSLAPTMSDTPSLFIKPRIIVSEDQSTPLQNKKRLNSARRSITKMWFNDRWRGLVLGIAAWLSEGKGVLSIPVGSENEFAFEATPQTFSSPVSIAADPISATLNDSVMEANDEAEFARRLSDPAFATPDKDGEDDDD